MQTSAGEGGAAGTAGESCVAVGGKELCGVKGDGGATSGSQDSVVTSARVREGDGGATSGSQDSVVTSASVGDATDGKVPVVKSAVGGAGASSTVGSASGCDISVDPRVGEKYEDASVDSEPSQYIGKSHNKRRQCPFCQFHGVHLARHLASMHPDCAETEANRARIVYKADEEYRQKRGLKTTLTNPEERLYQCGLPNCTAIVTRMSQHLKRAHKLKHPGDISAAKSSFKRLTGKRTSHGSQEDPKPSKKPRTDSLLQRKLVVNKSRSDANPKAASKKPIRKTKPEVESDSSSSKDSAQVKYDNDSDDSLEECDDDSGDDAEPQVKAGVTWADFYRQLKERDATTRGHFVSTFFRYLLHMEGGCHSEEQVLIQTRQVNIILDTIDPQGEDLDCLIRNDGLDFWDKFAGPKLTNKELTSNTLKVYIRSLELFITFIEKNLFYRKDLLSADDKEAIIRLNKRLPDYRATVHRRTAHQTTTRKVNESIEKINPEDIRKFENSALAKTVVKLLGEGINHRPLAKTEFICVRDYLLVTALYENGSRPGPLENAKISRLQAVFTESKK